MTRHSHRKGVTRDLHEQTRVRPTTQWSCDRCPPDRNRWTVGREATVLASQAEHRATHSLALREAVEALAIEADGAYVQALR
jgi:hypothetical protein